MSKRWLLTNPTCAANSVPESPPTAAPMANAQNLEAVGRDAGELGGVLVLAHRDPRAAHPGPLQVPHEEQHDDDDRDGQPVEALRVGLAEQRAAVGVTPAGPGDVLEAPVAAQRVDVVGEQPHDLPEAQGDDREVVAAQPQRRGPEDDPGDHGDDHGDRHDRQPREAHPELGVRGGQHRRAVGADGEEADVPEVEQACLADDDVEPDRDEREHRGVEQGDREVGRRFGGDDRRVDDRQEVDEDDDGHEQAPLLRPAAGVPPARRVGPAGPHRRSGGSRRRVGAGLRPGSRCGGAVGRLARARHTRAFPSDSPRIPVGRNIRTPTSRTNATTSRQSPPNSDCP